MTKAIKVAFSGARRSSSNEWLPLSDFAAEFLPDIWRNPPPEALSAGHRVATISR